MRQVITRHAVTPGWSANLTLGLLRLPVFWEESVVSSIDWAVLATLKLLRLLRFKVLGACRFLAEARPGVC